MIFYISNKRSKLIQKIINSGVDLNFQDRIGRTASNDCYRNKESNGRKSLIEKNFDKELQIIQERIFLITLIK